ncbi:MAG: glycosyltransferase, partial [Proteiniphilum sp.]|nr:glycosyltransferase [Proteiniphilum sp.]
MNPMISVIVPVYNVEKYLRKCLESILAQTYTSFELLLVNDGSTDGSGQICDEYAQKDSRVQVFHQENKGVSRARNLGLERAKGKWVAFIDSDDWVDSTYLEHLLEGDEDVELRVMGLM